MTTKTDQVTDPKTAWFSEAAFGMFIHWGAYSLLARGEWVMCQDQIPPAEYNPLAWQFNPRRYHPEEWVALARSAGMKYMVLTAKHHDGFALFDSQVSDFTSVKTAARRDLVAEYVRACRQGGLKVGLYFSLADWQWPAFQRGPKNDPKGWAKFREFTHAQVAELCSHYGKIDLLWYDYMIPRGHTAAFTAADWGARKLNAMVRKLQPDILINNRSGLPEDFDTPEGQIAHSKPGRRWEACMTLNRHWAWFADDDLWKSPREIVINLTGCACGSGNYLLNVGPKADGSLPAAYRRCLPKVGQWLKRNGAAIYGAQRCSIPGATFGVTITKGKMIYLVVHWWPGKTMRVPQAGVSPKSAFILSTGQKVKFERRGDDLFFYDLPVRPPDPYCTVVALRLG